MKKSKIKKYILILLGITVFFVFFWTYPVIWFMDYASSKNAPVLNNKQIFLNIMGPTGNFINPIKIVVVYSVILVFALYFIFIKEQPWMIVRLKSRKTYVNEHMLDVVLFSLFFVFLIEAINVIGAFCVFNTEIVLNFKLIQYSMIDFISLLLFYTRVGILLFIVGIITNKKAAPFITLAIIFIECFSSNFVLAINDIWLPFKDAISVIYLLTGNMQPINIIPVIIRGLLLNCILIAIAYFLFAKKDVISNEKK